MEGGKPRGKELRTHREPSKELRGIQYQRVQTKGPRGAKRYSQGVTSIEITVGSKNRGGELNWLSAAKEGKTQ